MDIDEQRAVIGTNVADRIGRDIGDIVFPPFRNTNIVKHLIFGAGVRRAELLVFGLFVCG